MAATSVIPTPPGYVVPTPPGYVVRPPEGHAAPDIPSGPSKAAPYMAWSAGDFVTAPESELGSVPPSPKNTNPGSEGPQSPSEVDRVSSGPQSLLTAARGMTKGLEERFYGSMTGSDSVRGHKETVKQKTGLFGFADKDSIKAKVRGAMIKERNRADFLHKEGWAQRIARHSVFDNLTLLIIGLNAIWIWIDTDFNGADNFTESDAVFQVVEHCFCAYFTLEILIRFAAFSRKRYAFKDGWFIFDSLLVLLMVFETWILLLATAIRNQGPVSLGGDTSVLRLFRLLRLSRLVRMLRSLPELMILVKGMLTAMRSVAYVIGLLAMITYVFAIALTQLSRGTEFHTTYFDHVPLSMYSLLVHGTFTDDLSGFCNDIRSESPVCLAVVFTFIALACLAVMNMLIGVLCEVVSSTAATEREEILTHTVSEKMQSIIGTLDGDSDNQISFEEFRKIMNYPEALQALEDVGVDPMHIVDFAELWFFDDGVPIQQSFDSFMDMVLDLRSNNGATVKDIKHLWLESKQKFTNVEQSLNQKFTNVDQKFNATKTSIEENHGVLDKRTRRLEAELSAMKEEMKKELHQMRAEQQGVKEDMAFVKEQMSQLITLTRTIAVSKRL